MPAYVSLCWSGCADGMQVPPNGACARNVIVQTTGCYALTVACMRTTQPQAIERVCTYTLRWTRHNRRRRLHLEATYINVPLRSHLCSGRGRGRH
jgi:hypothetical protein